MKYYGVNLGGWLVLERWITPSLFEGLRARDETEFCEELGLDAPPRLEVHRNTYITEQDIAWLHEHGVNALRVPIPHWVFGGIRPYQACDMYVDWLLDVAARHDMQVLLDLHTAPGSQNGQDHSGKVGAINWPKLPENIDATVAMLEAIALRWGNHHSVMGLELLNEPSASIDRRLLVEFYERGIDSISSIMPGKYIVVHDAFRPKDWQHSPMVGREGVVLDMHLYQAFDKPRRPDQHIRKAREEWRTLLEDTQSSTMPVLVGEWSLGLDPRVFRGLDDFGRDRALQAFGAAQIDAFSVAQGMFFWTYKTETMPGWSLQTCIKRGWLAQRLLQ